VVNIFEVKSNIPNIILDVAELIYDAVSGFEAKRELIKSAIQDETLNKFWNALDVYIDKNIKLEGDNNSNSQNVIKKKMKLIASIINVVATEYSSNKLTDSEIEESRKKQVKLAKNLKFELTKSPYSPTLRAILIPTIYKATSKRKTSLMKFKKCMDEMSYYTENAKAGNQPMLVELNNYHLNDIDQPTLVELLDGLICALDYKYINLGDENLSDSQLIEILGSSKADYQFTAHVRKYYESTRSKAENTWVKKPYIYLENELFEVCRLNFCKTPEFVSDLYDWLLKKHFPKEKREFSNACRSFNNRKA
jgi:hypothetical protein